MHVTQDPEKKKNLLRRYVKLITLLQCRNLQVEVIETSVEIVVIGVEKIKP